MNIECGPKKDRRILTINLPSSIQHIGVLISGGIDSALLYYLLMVENKNSGNNINIIPYSIMRKDGSKVHASPVVHYISELFGVKRDPIVVGDNTLPEKDQVLSGLIDIWDNHKIEIVYVGVIETLDIHKFGYIRNTVYETDKYKIPMQNLNKSHVIDLVNKFGQNYLFELTHGCLLESGRCGVCAGCKERAWGFEQMGLKDPGFL